MSGSIGVVNYHSTTKSESRAGRGGVQIHLGSSEYHFNQVMDLVAPYARSDENWEYALSDPEGLDAEALERLAMLTGERTDKSVAWKRLAALRSQVGGTSGKQRILAQLGRSAYKVQAGTSHPSAEKISADRDGMVSVHEKESLG